MKMQTLRAALFGLAGLTVAASVAGAAVITTDFVPQSGSGWYSSQLLDFDREAENIANNSFDTVNENNPDAGPGHTNLPGNSMWLTTVPGFGGADTNPFVIVDLGAEYSVASFQVWNYNELNGFNTRGVQNVEILSSTTPGSGNDAPAAGTFTSQGNFTFAQAPGTAGYVGQVLGFATPFTARYIKLDINSNWGGDGFGLSEIQFNTSPIPEPASLGLIGLGAMALARRGRKAR